MTNIALETKKEPVNLKYTRDEIARGILEAKGLITQAALIVGCTPQTIHNYIARYPDLQDVLNQAREQTIDIAERKLYELVEKGELGAVIFLLKTLGKSRGYIERSERVNVSIDIALLQKFESAAQAAGLQPGQIIEALIEQVSSNAPMLPSTTDTTEST